MFSENIGPRTQAKNTFKTFSDEFDRQSYEEETTWKTKALMTEHYWNRKKWTVGN